MISYGENVQLSLLSDFSGNAISFSLLGCFWLCACCKLSLLCYAFIILNLFFILSLSETFYHEGMMDFIKGYLASNEMIMSFLSFSLFMWFITFISLCMLSYPCMSRKKPTWSCWIIISCVLSFSLQVCYWEFCTYIQKEKMIYKSSSLLIFM